MRKAWFALAAAALAASAFATGATAVPDQGTRNAGAGKTDCPVISWRAMCAPFVLVVIDGQGRSEHEVLLDPRHPAGPS